MCGIAGYCSFDRASGAAEAALVADMSDRQFHRGPNAGGIYQGGRVVLGFRRLAILDLSENGNQPMSNEDGTIWVVFNGEIYNYRELRQELTRAGHVFHGNSDTQVLVHGYEEWGTEGLLQRLRGMFAFALYDQSRERAHSGPFLLLARDRIGIKPLYYLQTPTELIFASEVQALRQATGHSELDANALVGFLCLGSVPAPRTYIQNIRGLPPGTYLEVGSSGAGVKKYWDAAAAGSRETQDLRELLIDTVDRHLLADVPLGVFLSGGLDSGALVALASRVRETLVLSLTVSFPEAEFSESEGARAVAQAFRTQHTEIRISDRDFVEEIPRILDAMDQPTADGINTYFVSKAAREAGLTVVLSGLGGDEVFFGYPYYRKLTRANRWLGLLAGIPGPLREALLGPIRLYGQRHDTDKWQRLDYLNSRRLEEGLYLVFRGFFGPRAACDLLGIGRQELERTLEDDFGMLHPKQPAEGWSVTRFQYLESQRYLHDQLLRDSDVFSMAHSLELRVPFLDHILVEHCARIPASAKISPTVNKPLLAAAVNEPVIDEAARRKKRGFTFPFVEWMRIHAGELEELAVSGGPLNRKAVARCWEEFRAGRSHWSRAWSTTVLAAAARKSAAKYEHMPVGGPVLQ